MNLFFIYVMKIIFLRLVVIKIGWFYLNICYYILKNIKSLDIWLFCGENIYSVCICKGIGILDLKCYKNFLFNYFWENIYLIVFLC